MCIEFDLPCWNLLELSPDDAVTAAPQQQSRNDFAQIGNRIIFAGTWNFGEARASTTTSREKIVLMSALLRGVGANG
jgi:hypothetical protein